MRIARLALLCAAVIAVGIVLVSGGEDGGPRTPAALPGLPPPFLGTAVAGDGGLTAAVDAYGDVVDLRPGPAGPALIDNPADRQAAGTVAEDTGIVPRVSIDGAASTAMWEAERVTQRYLAGTNVVRTVARFGRVRVTVDTGVDNRRLALVVKTAGGVSGEASPSISVDVSGDAACRSSTRGRSLALLCMQSKVQLSRRFLESQPAGVAIFHRRGSDPFLAAAEANVARAAQSDRLWLAAARPLAPDAPAWARAMYRRSLLTLRALTDRRTGAVAAGARDGWAYVWPRDAASAALALTAAGYRSEARRIVDFLDGLDVSAAARFHGDGSPVAGRGPQGDAAGWIYVAAAAFGLDSPHPSPDERHAPDYQEATAGTYLANAIAASAETDGPKSQIEGDKSSRRHSQAIRAAFETARGLVSRAGDPASGLDSAAAWAVRPFPLPALFHAARRTLVHLAADKSRFGITPGEGWTGGADPWTAPTAWTAWSFAALADAQRHDPRAARADHREALSLLGDLRRAATPAGSLPERVDVRTGVPSSTTPLTWSHAFAILALRQLWQTRR
jgi:glucoamylase